MRGHQVACLTFGDAWSADDEWDVDVLFETAFFAGLQTVLADVVAVVGRVENVRVVENAIVF